MIYSSGLVPACEELRKLRAEGNLEAQDDEFEDVDEEHYENMDGENGVSKEDLGSHSHHSHDKHMLMSTTFSPLA